TMSENAERPYIGGQAVIEGVMMRSPRSFSIVVRRKTGELVVRERPVSKAGAPGGFARWPFVRGVATLVEAVKLGSEALRFSSGISERDHLDEGPPGPGPGAKAAKGAFSALASSVAALATGEPEPRGGGEGPSPAGGSDTGRRLLSVVTIVFAILLFVV